MAPHVVRVETSCNVADGPTRDDFRFLVRLNARWREPAWPEWIEDYWTIRPELKRISFWQVLPIVINSELNRQVKGLGTPSGRVWWLWQ